jgi:GDP-L-fucose synthase
MMEDHFRGRRVVVTGGGGFIGSFVVDRLRDEGCDPFVPRRSDYDLRSAEAIRRLMADARPEIVIHLAGTTGGIGANRDRPAEFIHDNLVMGTCLIEESRLAGATRFVCIGTICSYPKQTPVPFRESELWNGYPDEVSAPYGVAKMTLAVQLDAYRRQYGFEGVFVMPANVYGPRDRFDPSSSNVVAALIKKFVDASRRGDEAVTVWGSGRATREFLYVEDCAEGILMATRSCSDPAPVNLGSGVEVSIRDLAETIARIVGYRGRIEWDPSKPDGQPRRCLDVSAARERFGFTARTSLEEGLSRTIDWYRSRED